MKNRIKLITIFFILLLSCTYIFSMHSINSNNNEKTQRNQIVELNEIEQLSKLAKEDSKYDKELSNSINKMQNELKNNSNYSSNKNQLTSFYILSLLFIIIIFLYIYIRIIRPFSKLENFALDVSKGNFDSPLYVERQNLFGDFTWAFDMMRCEIKKARFVKRKL